MHVTKSDVNELSHDGTRYTPDEEGRFDVPAHVGEWLIRVHDWLFAVPPSVPEPEPQPTNTDGSLIPTPDADGESGKGDGTDPGTDETPADEAETKADKADDDAKASTPRKPRTKA